MPMTSPRVSLVKVGHSLLLLFLLLLAPEPRAQKIPKNHNHVRHNEMDTFENSHVLVKGNESERYLYQGISRNFTFSIEKNCNIIITVTPCAAVLHWTLYMIPEKRSDLTFIGDQRKSFAKGQKFPQFVSSKREIIQVAAVKGNYVISINSTDTDSYVKILVSANPGFPDPTYPSVPINNQVNVLTNRRTLAIEWPSANSVNRFRKSLEYCVTISRKKNIQTHCGALAHAHGDKLPNFTSWEFQKEKEHFEELRRLANPIKKASRKMLYYQCVANKTSFTFTKTGRGNTYYVDVFVVDKETKMASSYTGASVKIKRSPKTKMKVGDIKTINLKRKMAVELKINSTLSRLAFEVIPCSGKIPFELFYNGQKNQTKILARRWRRHFVRNAEPGTYLMTFPGKRKKKTFVTVFITSKPSRSKIFMPKNRKIRFFDNLKTCSSVTVAWMRSSVEQSYCLYKKKLKTNGHDSKRRKCLSSLERPEVEREMCATYSATNSTRHAVTYNVTGLQPDTWYRFDVFVSRGRSAPVPYKSVKVKTDKCVS